MFDESESDEEVEGDELTNKKQLTSNKKTVFDMEPEEKMANEGNDGNIEDDSEEFVQLLKNLKVNIDEVNNNITPLIQRIKDDKIELKNVFKQHNY